MNRFAATTVLIVLAANVKAEEPFAIQIDSPQLSEAELLGSTAGRILGAAQMCGLNSDRLQSIARRVFAMIDQVGKDQLERISASERMRDGLNLGRDDVTAGRSTCKSIRSALAKLENQVAKRP